MSKNNKLKKIKLLKLLDKKNNSTKLNLLM